MDKAEDNQVEDNRAAGRYELACEGGPAIAAYDREGDVLVFTHTEVPAAAEGHGVGTRLIDGAMADVRSRGLKVDPACPFVAAWFERHPEQADLLAGQG